jgi:chromosome transmission fidelity protein 1
MPYSMLLSKSARSAVGLSLKEALVLVDEAHNLPEAIRALHSSRLNLPATEAALEQLSAYTQRYASRLAGRNLYYLGQIRKCLQAFIKYLKSGPPSVQSSKMISSAELLIELKLDNVNIFKIIRYLDSSRLPQKLLGFTSASVLASNDTAKDSGEQAISKHVSALSIVQTFLEKLTSTSKEGKVVTDWPTQMDNDERSNGPQHPTLRFVLLHPAAQFQNVLEEAHGVALVGGTLKPFAHVAAELLGTEHVEEAAKADGATKMGTAPTTLDTVSSALTTFTCDHVVPSSNVKLECMSMGPTNQKLDFRHKTRTTNIVCDELGQSILEVCKRVPSGVVIFLPSYSYEAHLVRRWKATGIWDDLVRQKKVHREPKNSQQVEAVLEAYSRDAQSAGAMLLSVVGGKMSEGINFANDMARCVMVVGLPYPDITDPELKEKMTSMDQHASKCHGAISGQTYYHNLCMRAVNQSVGRAIRHANDYAVIILADVRYSSDARVWTGLPPWLRRDVYQSSKSFKAVGDSLESFFHMKRSASTVSP